MAKNLSYKKAETTTLKAVGYYDADTGVIDIDGEEMKVTDLLKNFNGANLDLTAKVKSEEDLELSESDDENE